MAKILTSYHSLGRESLKPIGSTMLMKSVVMVGVYSPGRILYHPIPRLPAPCLMATETCKQPALLLETLACELKVSAPAVGQFASSVLAANQTIREMVSGVQGVSRPWHDAGIIHHHGDILDGPRDSEQPDETIARCSLDHTRLDDVNTVVVVPVASPAKHSPRETSWGQTSEGPRANEAA